MNLNRTLSLMFAGVILTAQLATAQVYDIFDFDETADGPWSDIDSTTLTVPMVPDGSITIYGSLSSAEFGNFEGRTVSPGSPDGTVGNAWILDFATAKDWEGASDSEFTFYLAHDSEYLYVGVEALDDDVISNDTNATFWKDDAIEIIIDANNDRANVNTDMRTEFFNDYGGHSYVNYEGRFSIWDEDIEESIGGWANAVDWAWGESEAIWGVGDATENGWAMEVRFHKSQFEDPSGGGPIEVGDRVGFNIGMDDDDGEDLAIQYWWANRARPLEFDALALEDGLTIEDFPEDEYDWVIDAAGRLTHGATGEIIFGGLADPKAALNQITDIDERVAYVHDVLNTWMGDSNCDGVFDSGDLVDVFTTGQYEDAVDGNSTWESGDWNGDGDFSSADFVVAFTDGGYEKGPRPPAAVPEPDAIQLLALSALALILRSRRR